MYLCRVISVNNKLLAGRKCDISVCTADIFKPRDYLVRGKSVFSYCGIILLTRPDYTFSRRATFSPDAFITVKYARTSYLVQKNWPNDSGIPGKYRKNFRHDRRDVSVWTNIAQVVT